jgi:hypothetical protein
MKNLTKFKTPTGSSLNEIAMGILKENPNINFNEAKEEALVFLKKYVDTNSKKTKKVNFNIIKSLFGERFSPQQTEEEIKQPEEKEVSPNRKTNEMGALDLKEIKRSIKKNEKNIQNIQTTTNKIEENVSSISKKISKIYDRISVKTYSMGDKTYGYDPLAPKNMQVKELGAGARYASKEGGATSPYSRVLNKAAQEGFKQSENINPSFMMSERISGGDIQEQIKSLKNEIQEIKKDIDVKLETEGGSDKPDAEQIQALQDERQYELEEFEKKIDKKLDEIIKMLKDQNGGILNKIKDVIIDLAVIKRFLGKGGIIGQAIRWGGLGAVADAANLGRKALGFGEEAAAGAVRAAEEASGIGRGATIGSGKSKYTLSEEQVSTLKESGIEKRGKGGWFDYKNKKPVSYEEMAEILKKEGLFGAATKKELSDLKRAGIVRLEDGKFKDVYSGAILEEKEALKFARDPEQLAKIKSFKNIAARRAAAQGSSSVLKGVLKSGAKTAVFSALVEAIDYIPQLGGTKELSKKNLIESGAGVAGGVAGAEAGAVALGTLGAALGTAVFPGVGTAIGGAVGGVVGGVGGYMAGDFATRSIAHDIVGKEDSSERLSSDEAEATQTIPEKPSTTGAASPLGNYSNIEFEDVKQNIMKNEGTASQKNPYDTVYAYGKYGKPDKLPTKMTIGEILKFQRDVLIPNTRGKVAGVNPNFGTGAIGAYQFNYGTLEEQAKKEFGENYKSVMFDEKTQDKLAKNLYDQVKGNKKALSATWAAFRNLDIEGGAALRAQAGDLNPPTIEGATKKIPADSGSEEELVRQEYKIKKAGDQAEFDTLRKGGSQEEARKTRIEAEKKARDLIPAKTKAESDAETVKSLGSMIENLNPWHSMENKRHNEEQKAEPQVQASPTVVVNNQNNQTAPQSSAPQISVTAKNADMSVLMNFAGIQDHPLAQMANLNV